MKSIDCSTFFGFWPKRHFDISLGKLRSLLDRNGVSKALVSSMKGVFYDFGEGNDETLNAASEDDRLVPVGTIDPRRYLGCLDEVERCADLGVKIFRFFPEYQGWPVRYLPFLRIVERLADRGIPFVFPASLSVGSITEIFNLVESTGSSVIMDSINYNTFSEAIFSMEGSEKIYCMTSGFATPDAFELFVDEIGSEKIVFGSGAPIMPFSRAYLPFEKAQIDRDARLNISSGNIERLIGI